MTPEIKLRIEQIQNGSVPDGYKKLNVSDYCIPNEWTTISMSDLFTEFSEKNHPDSDVLTIIQGTGTVLREESGREIIYDSDSLSNYKFVKKGDFIIHLRSFEGGLEIANQDGIVSPAYIILRPKTNIASDYYYALFHSNRFINQTMAPAVEGVRDGRSVKYEVLKNRTVPFPPLPELQKISKILFAQDKVIAFKQKLLQEKKQQKKYLMRKLLSADGTSFMLNGVMVDKSLWKKCFISEICKLKSGNPITAKEFDANGVYPVYGGNGLRGFTNTFSHEGKHCLIGRQGALCGNVKFVEGRFFASEHAIVVTSTENDELFLFYFFDHMRLNKKSESSAQPGLSVEKLLKLKSFLPTFPEQQVIAKVLSAADKEIELLQKSIEQEKQKKKALMQLLLTGIVRVKIYEC